MTLAIDTAPVIYLVEGHPRFGPRVRDLWAARTAAGEEVVASTLLVAEILPEPR